MQAALRRAVRCAEPSKKSVPTKEIRRCRRSPYLECPPSQRWIYRQKSPILRAHPAILYREQSGGERLTRLSRVADIGVLERGHSPLPPASPNEAAPRKWHGYHHACHEGRGDFTWHAIASYSRLANYLFLDTRLSRTLDSTTTLDP